MTGFANELRKNRKMDINTGNKTARDYEERRRHDIQCERLCSAYADEHFFSRLPGTTFERVTGEDEESRHRQKVGEDLVLSRNGKIVSIIDEKAKIQKKLNKVIAYPSFEIIRKPGPYMRHELGWFSHPVSNTTHYALISVASDKIVPEYGEYALKPEDLTCMVYGIVPKKQLVDWVEEETRKSMKEIVNDAFRLLQEWTGNPDRDGRGAVLDYRKDVFGKRYLYLKLSAIDGLPVNLVVRRDWLREKGFIKEFYIDDRRVSKYTPPVQFYDIKDEPLRRR